MHVETALLQHFCSKFSTKKKYLQALSYRKNDEVQGTWWGDRVSDPTPEQFKNF